MSTRKSFRIVAADHTGITVSNLERSLAFWRDVLGFELSHRAHQTGDLAGEITGVPGAEISLAVLKTPAGHKIELLEYLAPPDRKHVDPRPCDVGSVHVALTVDDLDAVLSAIAAFGWEIAGDTANSHDRPERREARCLRPRSGWDNHRVHAAAIGRCRPLNSALDVGRWTLDVGRLRIMPYDVLSRLKTLRCNSMPRIHSVSFARSSICRSAKMASR